MDIGRLSLEWAIYGASYGAFKCADTILEGKKKQVWPKNDKTLHMSNCKIAISDRDAE